MPNREVEPKKGSSSQLPPNFVVFMYSEVIRQAQAMASFFAEELKMSPEGYIATIIPEEPPLPDSIDLSKPPLIPLLVETRIPPERQCGLVDINYFKSPKLG